MVQRWKGTSKEEAIAGILTDLGEDASPARVAAVFDLFTVKIADAYRDAPPTPIPGVLETFDKLRSAGVKVALQTGYSAPVASSILGQLGWSVGETVDALVTSDLVPASRPAPYLVFRCMEATGVTDVRRVLVAGDTPNDLGAGTSAARRVRGRRDHRVVPTGRHSRRSRTPTCWTASPVLPASSDRCRDADVRLSDPIN